MCTYIYTYLISPFKELVQLLLQSIIADLQAGSIGCPWLEFRPSCFAFNGGTRSDEVMRLMGPYPDPWEDPKSRFPQFWTPILLWCRYSLKGDLLFGSAQGSGPFILPPLRFHQLALSSVKYGEFRGNPGGEGM